jgi:hypothetical protein
VALWVLIVANGVAIGWLGDGLKGECLFGPVLGDCVGGLDVAWRNLAVLLASGGVFLALYLVGRNVLPVRVLRQAAEIRPRRVVLLPLSALKPPPERNPQGGYALRMQERLIDFSGNLAKDIAELQGTNWNGQQILRGLRPHLQDNMLERVILIGSEGERGSMDMAKGIVRDWLGLYLRADRVEVHPTAVDFEDVQALRETFEEIVSRLTRTAGYRERDIVIDATGGQKTTSIAAALATLEPSELEFQYVETRDNPRVLSFNVVTELHPKNY